MDETQQPTTSDDRPLAGTDAASAPARRGFTLRGRTWVYGATLAVAGALAGTGVTYAVVSTHDTVQVQPGQQDGRRGAPPPGDGAA